MTDYDNRAGALLNAGFTDSQVKGIINALDNLNELFEPLKVRKAPVTRGFKYSDSDLTTARMMFRLITDKFPVSQAISLFQWADVIRKMRERDKRETGKIAELFIWAHEHHFWSANIRSPAKLRKQWDQLCAQKQQEGENGANQYI